MLYLDHIHALNLRADWGGCVVLFCTVVYLSIKYLSKCYPLLAGANYYRLIIILINRTFFISMYNLTVFITIHIKLNLFLFQSKWDEVDALVICLFIISTDKLNICLSFFFITIFWCPFPIFFLSISVCSSVCSVWSPRCPFCGRSLHDHEFSNEPISCFRPSLSLFLTNLSLSSALLLHTFQVNQIMLFFQPSITEINYHHFFPTPYPNLSFVESVTVCLWWSPHRDWLSLQHSSFRA